MKKMKILCIGAVMLFLATILMPAVSSFGCSCSCDIERKLPGHYIISTKIVKHYLDEEPDWWWFLWNDDKDVKCDFNGFYWEEVITIKTYVTDWKDILEEDQRFIDSK